MGWIIILLINESKNEKNKVPFQPAVTSYGQRLLLFCRQFYDTFDFVQTKMAKILNCSKQTNDLHIKS